jgi:hypothetical protein
VPRKQKKKSPRAAKQSAAEVAQLRPGMPAADSVQEVLNLVSPQGKKYEILRTNETDAYDPPLKPAKSGARTLPPANRKDLH